jgi:hypothetical protein
VFDFENLEADLKDLLSRSREDGSSFGSYVESFASKWLVKTEPMKHDIVTRFLSENKSPARIRPLDMRGVPPDGMGKADSA